METLTLNAHTPKLHDKCQIPEDSEKVLPTI